MRQAITHTPSPKLNECELTYLDAQPINVEWALEQHSAYCAMLERCGVKVTRLTENADLPDSIFVEDTAVVLDEVAILTPMGVPSREPETELMRRELANLRKLAEIRPPAKLEGGDVLRIGQRFFVGLSTRTNEAGIDAFEQIVRPFGYEVVPVEVTGCLHLKTGVTALDDETVLINPEWVDSSPFLNLNRIWTPASEPFAGNILRLGETICIHAGFHETADLLDTFGYTLETTDISEFLKAEAGLTCMSLIFSVP